MIHARRFACFLLLAGFGFLHAAPIQLAVVVRTKGDVTVGPEAAMRQASAGAIIMDGARLKTGENGRALVRFLADQSITEIKPNTMVDFCTRSQANGQGVARQIMLRAGEAAFGITPGKGRDMRFETATTVASVRGTNFVMSSSEDGRTDVQVSHGIVHVCNPVTGEQVDLHPGQRIHSDWNGLATDTSRTLSDSSSVPDSLRASHLEVDFIHSVTGKTRTIGISTQETSR